MVTRVPWWRPLQVPQLISESQSFNSSPPGALQPERLTQVHLTDLGVGKDFFRSAGGDYRALVDDVGPCAYPQGFAHIMVSDQHADATLGKLADDALNIEHRQRIDTREGRNEHT